MLSISPLLTDQDGGWVGETVAVDGWMGHDRPVVAATTARILARLH